MIFHYCAILTIKFPLTPNVALKQHVTEFKPLRENLKKSQKCVTEHLFIKINLGKFFFFKYKTFWG